jgi:hypothetical protein
MLRLQWFQEQPKELLAERIHWLVPAPKPWGIILMASTPLFKTVPKSVSLEQASLFRNNGTHKNLTYSNR